MATTKIDRPPCPSGRPARTGRTWTPLAIALCAVVAFSATMVAAPPAAHAVFSGDMSPRAPSGDPDYAAGMAAWEKEDWAGVVTHMAQVVSKRPHHDNAWARLGFAHRKLKRFEASLTAYGRALSINPHNRAALEYMGEAYVELGRYVEAVEVLDRLGTECKRVELTFSDGDFGNGCKEFTALRTLIELVGGDTSTVVRSWD
ncbi:tetratricopeptide repeat protein [Mongoliimonas terrestris]|uniref:tetratricopeptide repeat protein n=1 Tax=Mongoliimonas terrestris TaxID=1709001 RepID=UPI0009495A44|nr:tetratricopeptide repeat protein [Mongoliimonas terrestris]